MFFEFASNLNLYFKFIIFIFRTMKRQQVFIQIQIFIYLSTCKGVVIFNSQSTDSPNQSTSFKRTFSEMQSRSQECESASNSLLRNEKNIVYNGTTPAISTYKISDKNELFLKMKSLLRPSGDSDDEYGLPEEVEAECDERLQTKFQTWLDYKISHNKRFNDTFLKPQFRNPSIIQKMIEYLDLDEVGSNYDLEEFDPNGFVPEMYYEELAKAQQKAMMPQIPAPPTLPGVSVATTVAATAIQVAQQRAIEFAASTSQSVNLESMGGFLKHHFNLNLISAGVKKKKSRWDQ
ncbi:SAP30-binding protein [Nowakowskiella sp. JEL0078]|nr:SAP30-binding protein [Nowakowskiella sp. JEL0078]